MTEQRWRVRMQRAFTLMVVLLALTPNLRAASGGDEAKSWLMRVNEASRQLNYDGTFVYRNGEWMETVRIIHQSGPRGSRARMVALTGEAREVIRDENRITCILPESGSVVVSKKTSGVASFSVFNPSGDFASHYDLALASGERVAGRATRRLLVTPHDEFRYGYHLFVDEDTGLLLRSELVTKTGQPIEQIVFTAISLPTQIADELLEPKLEGTGYTWYTSEAPVRESQPSHFAVAWLPPGFQMADRQTDPAAAGRMPVEHVVYSDGLATISVFIEHLKGETQALKGLSSMGAVNAYGLMLDGYQVTAVGEVPPLTVEKVAHSVSQR